jgi:DegV family protein with EDD domain
LGLLVLKGAELASSGASLEDTAARVREVAKRTVSYAWLNTLEYLRRSGRLSFMKNSLASMLDIKPIMKMEEGSARMESVRTKKRAVARVLELVQDLGPIENIGITHFSAAEDVASIQPYLRSFLPQTMPILENYVTPTLGAHVGPGAVCISCIAEHPLDRIRLSKMERLKKAIRTITG